MKVFDPVPANQRVHLNERLKLLIEYQRTKQYDKLFELLPKIHTQHPELTKLSALLARERLVPVVHGTTYEALREVSPLLASRSGLSTAEDSMASVAAKLAELVTLEPCPATKP